MDERLQIVWQHAISDAPPQTFDEWAEEVRHRASIAAWLTTGAQTLTEEASLWLPRFTVQEARIFLGLVALADALGCPPSALLRRPPHATLIAEALPQWRDTVGDALDYAGQHLAPTDFPAADLRAAFDDMCEIWQAWLSDTKVGL